MPKRRTPTTPQDLPLPVAAAEMMRDLTRLLEREQFGSLEELNAFLQREVLGKPLARPKPTNDRERAEDLVLAARGERSLPRLRQRVREALALDPDCVVAHVLLADVSSGPVEALGHARDAVAAGERALAEELATDDHSLWYHPVGRPWLMARSLLSELLWQRGDRPLAMAEARGILARNPGDNQGIRYVLLGWLLQAGSVADIDALLAAHPDEASAMWHFGAALHRFRTEGPSDAATGALRAAIASNQHVVPILAGTVPMPDELPDTYTLGSVDEAAVYLGTAFPAWLDTAGAIEWAIDVERRGRSALTGARKRRR